MSRNKQVSETHLLGLLLAVVGGFLDAYTYLCRGRVFANAQTGNIVLLGVNLTEQNWNRTFYYLIFPERKRLSRNIKDADLVRFKIP